MFAMDQDSDEDNTTEEEIQIDLELFVNVIDSFGPNGKPALLLRKILSNKYEVQHILKKAFDDEAIIVKIKIKDKYLAIPRLARLGLLNPDEL